MLKNVGKDLEEPHEEQGTGEIKPLASPIRPPPTIQIGEVTPLANPKRPLTALQANNVLTATQTKGFVEMLASAKAQEVINDMKKSHFLKFGSAGILAGVGFAFYLCRNVTRQGHPWKTRTLDLFAFYGAAHIGMTLALMGGKKESTINRLFLNKIPLTNPDLASHIRGSAEK